MIMNFLIDSIGFFFQRQMGRNVEEKIVIWTSRIKGTNCTVQMLLLEFTQWCGSLLMNNHNFSLQLHQFYSKKNWNSEGEKCDLSLKNYVGNFTVQILSLELKRWYVSLLINDNKFSFQLRQFFFSKKKRKE